MAKSPMDEAAAAVAAAVVARTRATPARANALATAYVLASLARAVKVTTADELPPTAMKQAQIGLVVEVLRHLDDVPTAPELAALLRCTRSTARSLLTDVLATSDVASGRVLKSVFARATKGESAGPNADVPSGVEWRFASYEDVALARERLESASIAHSTRSTKDGRYVLLVDPGFDPGRDA